MRDEIDRVSLLCALRGGALSVGNARERYRARFRRSIEGRSAGTDAVNPDIRSATHTTAAAARDR